MVKAKPTTPASPRKPRTKKGGVDPALKDSVAASEAFLEQQKKDAAGGGLKPIGEAVTAAGLVVDPNAKPTDPAEGRTQPEYAMDKLAGEQRKPAPERGDPLDPIVIRGPNVDTVNGFKTTNKDQLQKLATQYQAMKDTQSTRSGEISDFLSKAEETKSLDTWAFKEAMKWRKMGDELKVRRLPIFMKYLDDLGVVDAAAAQGDMLAKDAEERAEKAAQKDIEDEAAKAAKGLAPGKKPTMSIVPKEPKPTEPTAESVFKPLH